MSVEYVVAAETGKLESVEINARLGGRIEMQSIHRTAIAILHKVYRRLIYKTAIMEDDVDGGLKGASKSIRF
jgi:hypothetical protein